MEEASMPDDMCINIKFVSDDGNVLNDAPIVLPVSTTVEQMEVLCNNLISTDEEPLPLTFWSRNGTKIEDSIGKFLSSCSINFEKNLEIIYAPEALFRVRPVARCTSSIPGHGEPVVSIQFSPDSRNLASGSCDKTVRFWDLSTELPLFTCANHESDVLCLAWAPNGSKLGSASKAGEIIIWDPTSGKQIGKKLHGHKSWINWLVWEPYHLDCNSRYLASAGKDSIVRIWDTVNHVLLRCLTGHKLSITCIAWGGSGLMYTSSQDRTVKVWRTQDGVLCRTLVGHAHWVNFLALSVDYVLRSSYFDPNNESSCPSIDEERIKVATERYESVKNRNGGEILVSASDDFTLYLWHPESSSKPIARMTGHQQTVIQAHFSPNARYIASASFDKSIKLWCGRTGRFIDTLRGHVQAVYQVSWSPDSRLLVSGSADSTLKVWNVEQKKLEKDLSGHGDAVFAVDWSPNGERVASGGRDKVLKLWRS